MHQLQMIEFGKYQQVLVIEKTAILAKQAYRFWQKSMLAFLLRT
jgi:hypothetical protein